MRIEEGHEHFEKLKKLWEADGKPKGWITYGGRQYKIFTPSDDVVFFTSDEGGIDSHYGSRSTRSLSG
jgi:hypothetical protein